MYLLLETIKLADGAFCNLSYHNERLNKARLELGGYGEPFDLADVLTVTPGCSTGIYKCRIIYRQHLESITIEPYRKRFIGSLRLIIDNDIQYAYKFADREQLHALWERRAGCDEILIVKNNRLTDTSFSNLAFFTGRQWLTPHAPLLNGTKRAQLLAAGLLTATELTVKDLRYFKKVALINAMLDLGDCVIDAENICTY